MIVPNWKKLDGYSLEKILKPVNQPSSDSCWKLSEKSEQKLRTYWYLSLRLYFESRCRRRVSSMFVKISPFARQVRSEQSKKFNLCDLLRSNSSQWGINLSGRAKSQTWKKSQNLPKLQNPNHIVMEEIQISRWSTKRIGEKRGWKR